MKPSGDVDQTLYKSLMVLEAVASSSEPCGITELADKLSLTKSNTHRILRGFVSLGYLRVSETRGRYELTSKLWEMGSHFFSKLDVHRICAPYMTRIAAETQETVLLSSLEGTEVLFLGMIESSQAIRAYTAVGQRAPAHCISSGQVQLAWANESILDLVKADLTQHTPNTITNAAELDERLETIRREGFAISECEWNANANAVAVPIFNAVGAVIAGIAISGPDNRLDRAACIKHSSMLIEIGKEISGILGYREA
ncbi:IclR family transcriptional regulator [Rhodobacteraceae bacterium LMO-12]|nr:IclR family transcriptional regulator [Rhodobacteraceae bacterium LMO-JJ12]